MQNVNGLVFLSVLSGQTVSSAWAMSGDRAWALYCGSAAQTAVRIQFTTQSGGNGEPSFYTYVNLDGLDTVVASSTVLPAVGLVEWPCAPWQRIKLGSAPSSTISFTAYPINRR